MGRVQRVRHEQAAIVGLTKGLARDLGPRGITVNNVQPGPVNTDMNPADGPMASSMHGLMALSRHAHPDEIAGMVAGRELKVTGRVSWVDGQRRMYNPFYELLGSVSG